MAWNIPTLHRPFSNKQRFFGCCGNFFQNWRKFYQRVFWVWIKSLGLCFKVNFKIDSGFGKFCFKYRKSGRKLLWNLILHQLVAFRRIILIAFFHHCQHQSCCKYNSSKMWQDCEHFAIVKPNQPVFGEIFLPTHKRQSSEIGKSWNPIIFLSFPLCSRRFFPTGFQDQQETRTSEWVVTSGVLWYCKWWWATWWPRTRRGWRWSGRSFWGVTWRRRAKCFETSRRISSSRVAGNRMRVVGSAASTWPERNKSC